MSSPVISRYRRIGGGLLSFCLLVVLLAGCGATGGGAAPRPAGDTGASTPPSAPPAGTTEQDDETAGDPPPTGTTEQDDETAGNPPPAEDPPGELPRAPLGLRATPVPPDRVWLEWSAAQGTEGLDYLVRRDGVQQARTGTRVHDDSGLSAGQNYRYTVTAVGADGTESAAAEVTVRIPAGRVLQATPADYLGLVRSLQPGDTLILAPGDYNDPADVPGLPFFGIQGTVQAPITVMGHPALGRPVLLGRSSHNTIRFSNASHITLRHLAVDGRNAGGDAVNSQGTSHHITLEDIHIHGVGSNQQVVGISTNSAPTWNWTIRRCVIEGAGTGMYLGNFDGTNPFVAGLIEHNLVRDTIGYNIQIKHQNVRPTNVGLPTQSQSTVIRHNVFTKSSNSSTGGLARPNLLVGHLPPSGPGVDDFYEIYGNFFYQNPSEALFQGEGNIAFHHNLLVNEFGTAVNIQPHNGQPREVHVFNNTILASGTGIRVTGGLAGHVQEVAGNAVFAGSPIQADNQRSNVSDSLANAGDALRAPSTPLGTLDLRPREGALDGPAIDHSAHEGFLDWDRDFDGMPIRARQRGAYRPSGKVRWKPGLAVKP